MSSSSSSSSICSQGAVLATAVAVSGTVILLAIRHHKSQLPLPNQPLRPCLSSSGGRKKEMARKSKKRVQFAKTVVEPRGDGEKFRRKQQAAINNNVNMNNNHNNINSNSNNNNDDDTNNNKNNKERGMPANRVALYNGIIRDRLVQRLAYSY